MRQINSMQLEAVVIELMGAHGIISVFGCNAIIVHLHCSHNYFNKM